MLEDHRQLIGDAVRTGAYAAAIRAVVKPGDVVIDIGSGSGILALLACEAGARHVFAIEKGHAADVAMFLARHNGVADRVTVLHEHSTKVELPERADVLVTETLGSHGLEERILATVIDARRRLLRPDARLIPRRIVLSLVPVENAAFHDKHIAWWSEPRWGVDFSPLRVFAANAAYVDVIEPGAYLAAPASIIDVDLGSVEDPAARGSATFIATRDGVVHGFGGWFAATLAPGVELSNAAPRATHWDQAFLPLEQPLGVRAGTIIEVELQSVGGRAWRWRGTLGAAPFDQMTWLSAPPCELARDGA